MTKVGQPCFDWGVLVPYVIHPIRVAIIEAMLWTGHPVSASDLSRIYDHEYSVGRISYHFGELAKAQVIERVHTRPRRGAMETFYFIAPQDS